MGCDPFKTKLNINLSFAFQVIKMLVIVVTMFGLCWFPLQFYNVIVHMYPDINE